MVRTPPSGPKPPQSCPSTIPQFAGPPGGDEEHVPIFWPLATVQVPVQQSVPLAHESPAWPQNDEAWQVPLEQSPEQHCEAWVQALPSVLQVVLSGVQVPLAPHVWPQHWPLLEHASLSETQGG
jgi:hypothetical protein